MVDSGSASLSTFDYDLLPSARTTSSSTGRHDVLLARSVPSRDGPRAQRQAGDPKFADAAAGNFHLWQDSPAIDSANSGAAGQPAVDCDGIARVDDLAHTEHRRRPPRRSTIAAPRVRARRRSPAGRRQRLGHHRPGHSRHDHVLANDSDPDNDPLTVTGASVPPRHRRRQRSTTPSPTPRRPATSGPTRSVTPSVTGTGQTASATVSITVNRTLAVARRAIGIARPGHHQHRHPHRHRPRRRPADVQGRGTAQPRQALRRHRHRRPPDHCRRAPLRADRRRQHGDL